MSCYLILLTSQQTFVLVKTCWSHLEDVLQTSWTRLENIMQRRLEGILKTYSRDLVGWKRYIESALKTCSRQHGKRKSRRTDRFQDSLFLISYLLLVCTIAFKSFALYWIFLQQTSATKPHNYDLLYLEINEILNKLILSI